MRVVMYPLIVYIPEIATLPCISPNLHAKDNKKYMNMDS